MKRLVDHSLRLGLDEATYQYVDEIYKKRKEIISTTSRNDVLVELIQNGILVHEGKINLEEEFHGEKSK